MHLHYSAQTFAHPQKYSDQNRRLVMGRECVQYVTIELYLSSLINSRLNLNSLRMFFCFNPSTVLLVFNLPTQ